MYFGIGIITVRISERNIYDCFVALDEHNHIRPTINDCAPNPNEPARNSVGTTRGRIRAAAKANHRSGRAAPRNQRDLRAGADGKATIGRPDRKTIF
jgi:hypothetical protein